MNIDLTQFVEEYLISSSHIPIRPDSRNDEACVITIFTEFFCAECALKGRANIELLLRTRVLPLSLPRDIISNAPIIIKSFFDFLAVTGRFPPGDLVANDLLNYAPSWGKNFHDDGLPKGEPLVNRGLEIGRNDPCMCGSGKKFKKCCMSLIA